MDDREPVLRDNPHKPDESFLNKNLRAEGLRAVHDRIITISRTEKNRKQI